MSAGFTLGIEEEYRTPVCDHFIIVATVPVVVPSRATVVRVV